MAHFCESSDTPNLEVVGHIRRVMASVRKEHFLHQYLDDLAAYFTETDPGSSVNLGEGPIDVDAGTHQEVIQRDTAAPSVEDVLHNWSPVHRYVELRELKEKTKLWLVHYEARLKATAAVFEVLEALLEGHEE